MLKSELFWELLENNAPENWLIPGLEQGKYKKSKNHLVVLGNKVVLKNKGFKHPLFEDGMGN